MRWHGDAPHRDNEWVALYRLFDDDGELLYVGISNNPDARFEEHEWTKPWYPRVAGFDLEWYPTRTIALNEEAAAIHAENPEYNVMRPWPIRSLLPPGPRPDARFGFSDLAGMVDAWLDGFTAPADSRPFVEVQT